MTNQTIENLWTLRDEIIDARIEEQDEKSRSSLKEQIDLLGDLAEALEAGADVMCDCITCESMIGAYEIHDKRAKTEKGNTWAEQNVKYYLSELAAHLERPFQHGGELVILRSRMFTA